MSESQGDSWRVRILDTAGNTHGAGVLLSRYQVLTSAPVVSTALRAGGFGDGAAPEGAEPVGEVRVDFTACALAGGRWRAWVGPGGWIPARGAAPGDLAVLEIAGEPPPDVAPAGLQACGAPGHRSVRIYGYPLRSPGAEIDATMVSADDPADSTWVTLHGADLVPVKRGFDGAGVVDVRTRRVLGCLVDVAPPGYGWARMVPVEVITQLLPGLRGPLSGLGGRGLAAGPKPPLLPARLFSRSWADADRRVVKRGLLSLFGPWRPESVRLFADTLKRRFGGYLPVPDYRSDPALFTILFEACLEQPGALRELFDVLSSNYSPARQQDPLVDVDRRAREIQQLYAKIETLDPEPLLTLKRRRELYELLEGVPFADAAEAYAESIEPTGQLLPPYASDCVTIARELEAANTPSTGLPPVVRFAEAVASRLAADDPDFGESIRKWTDQHVAQHPGLEGQIRETRSVETAASAARGRLALMLRLQPAYAPASYMATAQLQRAANDSRGLYQDNTALTLADLPALIDGLLSYVRQPLSRSGTDPIVEVIVPRPMLGLDFDAWPVGGVLPRRLGAGWPVVVRSMDRADNRRLHEAWQVKWTWLVRNSNRVASFGLRWLWGPEPSLDALEEAIRATPPVSLAFRFPVPLADRVGADEVSVAVRAGIPIMIWCRDASDATDFGDLEKLLAETAATELPDRIWKLRSADDSPLGSVITLLYDDANRIP